MKNIIASSLLILSVLASCKKESTEPVPVVEPPVAITYDNDCPSRTLSHIAIGSCFFQQQMRPTIFSYIQKKNPELYLGLGDNIYSDDYSGNKHLDDWEVYLTKKYAQLGDSAVFKAFRANVPIIATWDDHDFGMNNAAGDFANKAISKDVFFTFWNLPKSGKRWDRNGIYDSYYYGDADHRLQLIVLDLRWNLDNPGPEPISIITDTTKKMMSKEQWAWLKEELKKPAKVRIICSSTQFCTEHNGFETWANFPHEQERMFQTLRSTKAEGVFFISGDVHLTEINKRTPTALYTIYDFTSSGLAFPLHGNNSRPSIYREGNSFDQDNFGMIDINWNGPSTQVSFTAFDTIGRPLNVKTIAISDLKF